MNFELADTHCHLYFKDFEKDLTKVLADAASAGINRMLVPGIDLQTSRQSVELSETSERIYAAVGYHPNDSTSWDGNSKNELEKMAQKPRVCAIGEIGLDFYRDRSPRDKQFQVLEDQLKLAEKTEKPVILHCRNAFPELWQVIKNWHESLVIKDHPLSKAPGVFHSFSEGSDEYQELTNRNFLIGLGGPVTFNNAKPLQELVKKVDLEFVILETDCPFLTPHPFRGKRNEPKHIRLIAEKISELQNIPLEDVARITTLNAANLFRWRTSI